VAETCSKPFASIVERDLHLRHPPRAGDPERRDASQRLVVRPPICPLTLQAHAVPPLDWFASESEHAGFTNRNRPLLRGIRTFITPRRSVASAQRQGGHIVSIRSRSFSGEDAGPERRQQSPTTSSGIDRLARLPRGSASGPFFPETIGMRVPPPTNNQHRRSLSAVSSASPQGACTGPWSKRSSNRGKGTPKRRRSRLHSM